MRDIIIRGKCIKNGDWVEGWLIQHTNLRYYILWYCSARFRWYKDEVKPETVGQYVGIDDMNGVRIYEGDLIAMIGGLSLGIYPTHGEIVYMGSAFCMRGENKNGSYMYMSLNMSDGTTLEVIGNKHEKK